MKYPGRNAQVLVERAGSPGWVWEDKQVKHIPYKFWILVLSRTDFSITIRQGLI